MADGLTFSYVIYVQSTPEKVWQALTDADATADFWGHANVTDWQVGSTWEHRRTDGSGVADVVGTIVTSEPPRRLVETWREPGRDAGETLVSFDIEGHQDIVRVTVTQDGLPDEDERAAAAGGWSAVMSNLKSFLETGRSLPQPPWEMP